MANSTIIPAMEPPPGQVSNFIDPPYCGAKFVVVNCVFLPMALIALIVRTWTRVVVVRSVSWDDYLMIFAAIFSTVMTGVTLKMLDFGLGKHMWDVPLDHLTPWFLKFNVVAAIIYCAGTGFTKVSVCVFYLRIFPSHGFRLAVWSIVFIAVGYNVASVLANVFSCTPIAAAWDLTLPANCMNRPVFYFANAGLGIFTDFATVLVPIPWLRRLQMPARQKVAVGSMLAMGCSVGIVSCIRLASLYVLMNSTDLTWATTNALLWCTIELNLGITGGCMTAMRPFVRRYFPKLLGLSSYAYGQSGSRKYGHPLNSIPRDQPDFNNNSRQYSTRLQGGTDNASEEHILPAKACEGEEDGILRTVEFNVVDTRHAGA
ncbi:uncharacterized protein BO87DRAFT_408151 [Aspergillus neoniger CBS 115656]|uniref:Integral membrane protein n=2 Tax=Aspergillus subgen. Circumdati TaxID=2720871 RepID=A0A100I5P2_ASPNG|nr:integral membrane protein [Aspergillus neoniger CBS 115656]PYH32697.1 integral membrane protein [Aspergillus neoniger CBS 115656]GAQ35202.1 integral membrane protein [Aspergillus niger]